MPASGTSIFSDADGYQASLADMLDLLVLNPRNFHARLTWVELPTLRLLRAEEASPRVAYLRLPPDQVFLTFATQPGPPIIYAGSELPLGDIMFHSRGEQIYQRTTGACQWGCISLTPAALRTFGRSIADRELLPPPAGQHLRPPPECRKRLLHLHAQAIRIVETNLKRIGHQEVTRALDQDLIWALITCLTTGAEQNRPRAGQDPSKASHDLETTLARTPGRLLSTRELCNALGVTNRR